MQMVLLRQIVAQRLKLKLPLRQMQDPYQMLVQMERLSLVMKLIKSLKKNRAQKSKRTVQNHLRIKLFSLRLNFMLLLRITSWRS